MSESESDFKTPLPNNLPDNGFRGSAYEYDGLAEFARVADKLLRLDGEIDDSNWRGHTHEIMPGLSGQDMLNGLEDESDPVERARLRHLIMIYKSEIRSAVERTIQQGKLEPSQLDAKTEEIFNRPVIPEGAEIVVE